MVSTEPGDALRPLAGVRDGPGGGDGDAAGGLEGGPAGGVRAEVDDEVGPVRRAEGLCEVSEGGGSCGEAVYEDAAVDCWGQCVAVEAEDVVCRGEGGGAAEVDEVEDL